MACRYFRPRVGQEKNAIREIELVDMAYRYDGQTTLFRRECEGER
jgi:hypothetical protein